MDWTSCWRALFLSFFQQVELPLVQDETYSFYRVYAQSMGLPADCNRWTPSFVSTSMHSRRGPLAVAPASSLPSPNAPTRIGLPLARIEQLLRAFPDRGVLVEEAYVDLGGESA